MQRHRGKIPQPGKNNRKPPRNDPRIGIFTIQHTVKKPKKMTKYVRYKTKKIQIELLQVKIVSEMKNILDGVTGRLDIAEN